MSRRTTPGRVSASVRHDDQPTDEHQESTAPDYLERLAKLVASGEAPMPIDLNPDDFHRLVESVARQRRTRLFRYLARAIALDIHRSREPGGVSRDVEEQVRSEE